LPKANKISTPRKSNFTSKDSPTEELKGRYEYWRTRTLYSMMIGYAGFYLVRQNFAMNIPSLQAEFGFSKTQIGWIITLYSIIYGIGKSVNGIISDRMNARYFMSIGLIFASLINIFMAGGNSLFFFGALWSLNAWFQSMGWPPNARLLTHWYSKNELGTKWGVWNCSHQIGGAFIFILCGFLIEHYGWRSAFWIPGGLGILVSGFILNRLRDTPTSIGLPSIEEYKGEIKPNLQKQKNNEEEEHLTFKEIIFDHVLNNKMIWYVSLANFCVYVVRMGVFNWAPTFLKEVKGSALNVAGWQSAGFEVAGLFGGIAAGWLSDKVFKGQRGPVAALYMGALALFLIYFWIIPAGNPLLDSVALVCVGFFVYGPQVLVGVAAADYASKKAVGAATGLTGTLGYLGSALSGVGIGYIVDNFGWDMGIIFFISAALVGIFFFLLTCERRPRNNTVIKI